MHQPILPDGIDGDRRRPEGLLLSVMQHVSERIEEVERRHEERYNRLDEKHDKLYDKIDNLVNSINAWMDHEPGAIVEQCEKIVDEAIPTHKDNPDATPAEKRKEHRRAHAKWIARVESEMDHWARIREKVAEWAVIGALAMIVMAVWQFILKGPK
jgi:uncharacterized protein YdcH (DUF465 family)